MDKHKPVHMKNESYMCGLRKQIKEQTRVI
jgi:hypothetical protein